ncbi:hypothetical protein IMG5_131080 [Ichthyophthirius multifiliis]|uniref:PDEase domain-containing protein n=1 Tax=Ichthyophthirius multifiliis TaxID=5932 RepID=G0QWD5_ICHMU|nr:hypothetical protein IMG5_131080 [Ichthyophthirius multifiliis]EGR30482.1 hypothetical protein IMG5_131080 [Ichthyophthirius multifiliis]|eukprot:XP_004032069.1 hypothetical protein IMG5_131080 [Ichthyophthirius multifiliis]
MQCCHMLANCQKVKQILKNLESFALIFSGLCHDVGHTGKNNNFEIAVLSKLAIRYHDKSVLEQHHLAKTFKIMKRQQCNVLGGLNTLQYANVRRQMVSNILQTDIKQHFKLLQDFEIYWKNAGDKVTEIMNKENNENEIELLTGMIIHTADFTGASKKFPLSKQWSEKINQEFFMQYQEEGLRGVSQTAFMKDLDQLPIMSKAEKSFLNVIVLPLWQNLNDFYEGELQVNINNLNNSIEQWEYLSKNTGMLNENSGILNVSITQDKKEAYQQLNKLEEVPEEEEKSQDKI